MNITTLIGIVIGFGALVVAFTMEGGSLPALLNPSAAVIVFGGTLGATIISFPLERVLRLPALFVKSITGGALNGNEIVAQFVTLATKARREGLLALEDDAQHLPEGLLKKGLLLVIDGTDPELVRNILETEIGAMEKRHRDNFGLLEGMGGFAPTMGMIGTVMGLVNVLGQMAENPDNLGEAISVAFIATLYGVASANLLWLPVGRKLKEISAAEVHLAELMVEGVLAVHAGENPRAIQQKLEAFLSPAERGKAAAKPAAETAAGQSRPGLATDGSPAS